MEKAQWIHFQLYVEKSITQSTSSQNMTREFTQVHHAIK